MNASSKDGKFPQSSVTKVEDEVWEAFTMWVNKQHDILPNQYHYTYEHGDTLIYPEHIADLKTIETMVSNKRKKDAEKAEEERKLKERRSNKGKGLGGTNKGGHGFYGHTFRFDS